MNASVAIAGSATLAWSASTSLLVTGYNVYYGGASRTYTNRFSAGNNTSIVVSNLTPGITYYFALTSYDALGDESSFSSEAIYQVPATASRPPVTLSLPVLTKNALSFAIEGDTGARYAVEASSDLSHWVRMATNLTPFVFSDTNTVKLGQKFFRAVYLP